MCNFNIISLTLQHVVNSCEVAQNWDIYSLCACSVHKPTVNWCCLRESKYSCAFPVIYLWNNCHFSEIFVNRTSIFFDCYCPTRNVVEGETCRVSSTAWVQSIFEVGFCLKKYFVFQPVDQHKMPYLYSCDGVIDLFLPLCFFEIFSIWFQSVLTSHKGLVQYTCTAWLVMNILSYFYK